jgi:hypothetical protein
MNISFSPTRHPERLTLSKSGEVLTINGEAFDFSPLPDGATLPRAAVACDWLASDVERIDGAIHLTLILPHGANAPQETRFPAPVTIGADGPVDLPAYEEMSE